MVPWNPAVRSDMETYHFHHHQEILMGHYPVWRPKYIPEELEWGKVVVEDKPSKTACVVQENSVVRYFYGLEKSP